MRLVECPGSVRALAFSPDGNTLAYAFGRSGQIWLWDLNASLSMVPHNQPTPIRLRYVVMSLAFSPVDSNTLAVSDSLGRVTLWGVGAQQGWPLVGIHLWRDHPAQVAFTQDGQEMVGIGSVPKRPGHSALRRRACAWVVDTGRLRWALSARTAKAAFISLALSPGGTRLACGLSDRTVAVWEVSLSHQEQLLLHGQRPRFLSFSPDGQILAAGGCQGLVRLFRLGGPGDTRCQGPIPLLRGLCFTPDGRSLLTADGEGLVRVWDVATGCQRSAYDWNVGPLLTLAVAPDGMRAAVGGEKGLALFDLDG